jgi:hypothetical protein
MAVPKDVRIVRDKSLGIGNFFHCKVENDAYLVMQYYVLACLVDFLERLS